MRAAHLTTVANLWATPLALDFRRRHIDGVSIGLIGFHAAVIVTIQHYNRGIAMQNFDRPVYAPYARSMDMSVDQGLRSFMLGVFNYMALGVALTGLAAYLVASLAVTGDASQAAARIGQNTYLTEFGRLVFVSPLKWVLMLAPIGFVFALSAGFERFSTSTLQLLFWVFCGVMGVSMGTIFLVYKLGSIVQVFFMTGASFAALSLWGYTTKRDLTGMGNFLFMGLIGIVIAGLVNLFLASSALQFAISCIGILVFAGLTAFDTQRLKESYYDGLELGEVQKLSIAGALSLYLNFINMFQMMLSLFGNRND